MKEYIDDGRLHALIYLTNEKIMGAEDIFHLCLIYICFYIL